MNLFFLVIILSCFILILSDFVRIKLIRSSMCYGAILIYSLLIAFKGSSGSDTFFYERLYFSEFTFSSLFLNFSDVLFVSLMYIFKKGLLHFDTLNYLNAILAFISLNLLAKSKSASLVVLYISLIGLNLDFSTMRQSYGMHVFSILYFSFNSFFLSFILSFGFHKSAIFSFISNLNKHKLSFKSILLIFSFALVFYFIFLQRYMSVGASFLSRGGYGFIFQSLIVCGIMFLLRFDKKTIIITFVVLYFPVGYRVLFFIFVMDYSCLPKLKFNQISLIFLLIAFSFVKTSSFSSQSISIDGERSVVLHYMN